MISCRQILSYRQMFFLNRKPCDSFVAAYQLFHNSQWLSRLFSALGSEEKLLNVESSNRPCVNNRNKHKNSVYFIYSGLWEDLLYKHYDGDSSVPINIFFCACLDRICGRLYAQTSRTPAQRFCWLWCLIYNLKINVLFLRDVNTAIMELLVMAYALKTSCAKNIIGVIPYFPYSKQCKMRKRGSIVCKLLASMLAKAGKGCLL